MSIGLLGKKLGMTRVYDAKGKLRPVTVIAAGDNVSSSSVKTESETATAASRSGSTRRRNQRVNQARISVISRRLNSEPKKLVREFRLDADAPRRRDQSERDAVFGRRLGRRDRDSPRAKVFRAS